MGQLLLSAVPFYKHIARSGLASSVTTSWLHVNRTESTTPKSSFSSLLAQLGGEIYTTSSGQTTQKDVGVIGGERLAQRMQQSETPHEPSLQTKTVQCLSKPTHSPVWTPPRSVSSKTQHPIAIQAATKVAQLPCSSSSSSSEPPKSHIELLIEAVDKALDSNDIKEAMSALRKVKMVPPEKGNKVFQLWTRCLEQLKQRSSTNEISNLYRSCYQQLSPLLEQTQALTTLSQDVLTILMRGQQSHKKEAVDLLKEQQQAGLWSLCWKEINWKMDNRTAIAALQAFANRSSSELLGTPEEQRECFQILLSSLKDCHHTIVEHLILDSSLQQRLFSLFPAPMDNAFKLWLVTRGLQLTAKPHCHPAITHQIFQVFAKLPYELQYPKLANVFEASLAIGDVKGLRNASTLLLMRSSNLKENSSPLQQLADESIVSEWVDKINNHAQEHPDVLIELLSGAISLPIPVNHKLTLAHLFCRSRHPDVVSAATDLLLATFHKLEQSKIAIDELTALATSTAMHSPITLYLANKCTNALFLCESAIRYYETLGEYGKNNICHLMKHLLSACLKSGHSACLRGLTFFQELFHSRPDVLLNSAKTLVPLLYAVLLRLYEMTDASMISHFFTHSVTPIIELFIRSSDSTTSSSSSTQQPSLSAASLLPFLSQIVEKADKSPRGTATLVEIVSLLEKLASIETLSADLNRELGSVLLELSPKVINYAIDHSDVKLKQRFDQLLINWPELPTELTNKAVRSITITADGTATISPKAAKSLLFCPVDGKSIPNAYAVILFMAIPLLLEQQEYETVNTIYASLLSDVEHHRIPNGEERIYELTQQLSGFKMMPKDLTQEGYHPRLALEELILKAADKLLGHTSATPNAMIKIAQSLSMLCEWQGVPTSNIHLLRTLVTRGLISYVVELSHSRDILVAVDRLIAASVLRCYVPAQPDAYSNNAYYDLQFVLDTLNRIHKPYAKLALLSFSTQEGEGLRSSNEKQLALLLSMLNDRPHQMASFYRQMQSSASNIEPMLKDLQWLGDIVANYKRGILSVETIKSIAEKSLESVFRAIIIALKPTIDRQDTDTLYVVLTALEKKLKDILADLPTSKSISCGYGYFKRHTSNFYENLLALYKQSAHGNEMLALTITAFQESWQRYKQTLGLPKDLTASKPTSSGTIGRSYKASRPKPKQGRSRGKRR